MWHSHVSIQYCSSYNVCHWFSLTTSVHTMTNIRDDQTGRVDAMANKQMENATERRHTEAFNNANSFTSSNMAAGKIFALSDTSLLTSFTLRDMSLSEKALLRFSCILTVFI
jgi:hypothetical protein